jgi:hypothetical protein
MFDFGGGGNFSGNLDFTPPVFQPVWDLIVAAVPAGSGIT